MFGFGVLYLWRSLIASHFCTSGVSVFSTPIQRIQACETALVTPRLSPVRSHHGERDCSPEDPAASVGVLFHPVGSRTGECLPEGFPHRHSEKVVEPGDHRSSGAPANEDGYIRTGRDHTAHFPAKNMLPLDPEDDSLLCPARVSSSESRFLDRARQFPARDP